MHGGLSPDLNSMEQIRRVMRPTDVSPPDKVFHLPALNVPWEEARALTDMKLDSRLRSSLRSPLVRSR